MSELIGRLHPLMVHLPAGILLLACLAGFVAGKWQRWGNPLAWLFVTGTAGALLSVWSGLQMAPQGSYEMNTLSWHKWLGISIVVLGCWQSWQVLRHPQQRPSGALFLLPNGLLLALILAAGHLGGTLTHGPGFLAEGLSENNGAGRELRIDLSDQDSAEVYAHLVQPLLAHACTGCHQPGRMNGGLDLSSPEGIAAGGLSGTVIKAGQAAESELFRRVSLPASHPKFMPSAGPALSYQQVKVLEWWIANGASFDQLIQDAERSPELAKLLEERFQWTPASQNPLAGLPIPGPASESVLDSLRSLGFIIKPVAYGEAALEAMPSTSGARIEMAQLRALLAIREQLVWLNLAGVQLPDEALEVISQMPNLVKLRLERNDLSDKGLAGLTGLRHLRSLNLFGTGLQDSGLRNLAAFPSLEILYVGNTSVTPGGIQALLGAKPGLEVVVEE